MGYGDYKPENIISQVFVVFMICTSIVVLPSQFEQLIATYKERKKMGQNFHLNLTKFDKHVVGDRSDGYICLGEPLLAA